MRNTDKIEGKINEFRTFLRNDKNDKMMKYFEVKRLKASRFILLFQ